MPTHVITPADIHTLLAAPQQDPVLYLTCDGKLGVWAEALVSYDSVVLRHHEAVHIFGAAPDADTVRAFLPYVQDYVDEVAAHLYEDA
ncbi:hypothetical protein ACWC9Q_29710 [Streptomyces sp. NPDC001142]